MISFERILIAVDFSEPSRKAVSYGLSLADQFRAKVIIAHIVPESAALVYAFPTQVPDIEKEQYEKAKLEIEELLPPDHAAALDLRTIVKTGGIKEELLGVVKDEAVDLVVMGTHGRQHLGRWFIGSVTEHMLRKVPVPILTVSHIPAEKHTIRLVSLKRILYCTDLCESSGIGLNYAMELARGTGAQLSVIHVIDDDRLLWGPALIAHLDLPELFQERRLRLDQLIAQEKPPDITIETLLVEGKPFRKIIEIGEEREVDIIVLNLQSKSLLERALLGSTAERVVRGAHSPVLSVPVAVTR